MAEAAIDKATCENCGVEVRDGTSFCYNCGKPIADNEPAGITSNGTSTMSANAQAALDDLAERLKIEEAPTDDRLAQAAAERKRARVRARRNEVVWDAGGGRLFVLVTLLIFVMTAVVVFIAVYWK